MEDLKYIPFYLDWIELMRTKDTDAKKVAFFDAIVDYALKGEVPPAPMSIKDPHGVDYARRDGYLIANKQLDYILPKIRGGQSGRGTARNIGNQNARKQPKNDTGEEGKNNTETILKQNGNNTIKYKDKNNNNIFSFPNGKHTPFLDESFKKFWAEYPSSCPRKTDKKKCRAKWETIFKGERNPEALFKAILDGLGKWKRCDTWTADGGKFIRAPYVWLNNRNWEDAPATKPEDADEARRKRFVQTEQAIKEDLHRKGLL